MSMMAMHLFHDHEVCYKRRSLSVHAVEVLASGLNAITNKGGSVTKHVPVA